MLYQIFLSLYLFGIRLTSLYSKKSKLWLEGRRDWLSQLQDKMKPLSGKRVVWIHCASLGEFEQGRPVIETIKATQPDTAIVLSFFSPSGYEVRKDYEGADVVVYLPMDGKRNARDFIATVAPSLAIFVKYEFWHHYLHELQQKQVPSVIISAAFRKEQSFFKPYGSFFRKMLRSFSLLMVQDEQSKQLLETIGIDRNVYITGDTRYDRVLDIAQQARRFPEVDAFCGSRDILVAGSTWPADEQILAQSLSALPSGWKVILAPHETHEAHIRSLQQLFGAEQVLFSELKAGVSGEGKRLLIIDNIGMLSSLYGYGKLAYIGGGFATSGIHNVLEPAAFGLPVIFGPRYEKFVEARMLASLGLCFPIKTSAELKTKLDELCTDEARRKELTASIHHFMQREKGATQRIMVLLTEHKLL